jgi:hypothetical protein
MDQYVSQTKKLKIKFPKAFVFENPMMKIPKYKPLNSLGNIN